MMKKILIYALVLTVCLCGLWSLSGCDEEKAVIDVTLTVPEETPLFSIGEFDASLYSLTIRYLDGSERTIPLTEELIPDSEQPKFYTEGEQKIKVEYLGFPMEFSVAFGRYTFPEDIKLEAAPVTYDGQAHTVTMSGNIPAGTTVSYPLGNSFTGVGEHTVTAILSRENYVTKEFETTFEIKRGVYDLSNYSFVSDGFTYDGEEHQIEASGTLPLGVSVSYALYNEQKEKLPKLTAKDVGTYEYVATFSSSNPNYEAIDEKRVTMEIIPAKYDMSGVSLSNVSYTYSGETYSLKVNGTLPAGVEVYYEVKNSRDKIVTTVKNADVYTVTASFRGDSKNYLPIDNMSATLTVNPKVPVLGKFYLDPVEDYLFDGLEHHPTVATVVDLEAEEVRIEYRIRRGANVYEGDYQSESVNAGNYTLEAKFIYKDGDTNYAEIPSMYLSYSIAQVYISLPDGVSFPQTSSLIYNEENQMPSLDSAALTEKNLAATYVVRKGDTKTGEILTSYADAGTYTVEAVFSIANGDTNYQAPASLYSTYQIEQKDVTPENTFPAATVYDYNNTDRTPVLENEAFLRESGYAVYYCLYLGEGTSGYLTADAINAGIYTVEASFEYKGGNPNYKTSTLTRTFTIRSVTVDALKVLSPNGDFTYMQKVYDGTLTMPCDAALETLKKSYGIETTVRVRYGTKTTGFIIPIPTDCGTYTVEFSFKGEDANVTSEDQTIFVRYEIAKQSIQLASPPPSQRFTWTGKGISPEIPAYTGLSYSVLYYKSGETADDATSVMPVSYGDYYAYVAYRVKDTGNVEISGSNTVSIPFTIIPAAFSLGNLKVDGNVFLCTGLNKVPTYSAEELAKYNVEAHYKVHYGFNRNGSVMLYYTSVGAYTAEISFTYIGYDESVKACDTVYVPYVILSYEKEAECDGSYHTSSVECAQTLHDSWGLNFNILLRNEGETTGPDLGLVKDIGKYTLELQVTCNNIEFTPTTIFLPYQITRIKVPVGKNVDAVNFPYNGENQMPTYLPPTNLDDTGYEGLSPKDLLEQKYGITYDFTIYAGCIGFHDPNEKVLTKYSEHGQYTLEIAFHSASDVYMADEAYKFVTFYIDPITVYLPDSFAPIAYVFNGQALNLQMGVDFPNVEGVKVDRITYYRDTDKSGTLNAGDSYLSYAPNAVGNYVVNVEFDPVDGYGNYVFEGGYYTRNIAVTIVPREMASSEFSLSQYIFVANGKVQKATGVAPAVFGENPSGFSLQAKAYQGFDNTDGEWSCSMQDPGKYTIRLELVQDKTNVIVVGDNVKASNHSDRTNYTMYINVVMLDAKYNSAILTDTFYDASKFAIPTLASAGEDGNLHGVTPTYDGLALPDCFVVETLYFPTDGNGVYKDGVKTPGVYHVECTIKTIDPRNTFSVTLQGTFAIFYS